MQWKKIPTTIDQALQFVKSSVHNQKILLGYRKPEIKRVQFTEEIDEEIDDQVVRQVKTGSNITELSKKYDAMEYRMTKTEKHIIAMKSDINKILDSISNISVGNRDRSRSPSPRRSPSREVRCYNCNELGHYSTYCPKKMLSPVKGRSSSPMRNAPKDQDLNTRVLRK